MRKISAVPGDLVCEKFFVGPGNLQDLVFAGNVAGSGDLRGSGSYGTFSQHRISMPFGRIYLKEFLIHLGTISVIHSKCSPHGVFYGAPLGAP